MVRVVAVDVRAHRRGARVGLAVLAPLVVGVPGQVVDEAVGVDREDDPDAARVDQVLHRRVGRVVVREQVQGVERLLQGQVLERVVQAVDEDLRLGHWIDDVAADLGRPDVAALVALADREDLHEVGVRRLHGVDVDLHPLVVVVQRGARGVVGARRWARRAALPTTPASSFGDGVADRRLAADRHERRRPGGDDGVARRDDLGGGHIGEDEQHRRVEAGGQGPAPTGRRGSRPLASDPAVVAVGRKRAATAAAVPYRSRAGHALDRRAQRRHGGRHGGADGGGAAHDDDMGRARAGDLGGLAVGEAVRSASAAADRRPRWPPEPMRVRPGSRCPPPGRACPRARLGKASTTRAIEVRVPVGAPRSVPASRPRPRRQRSGRASLTDEVPPTTTRRCGASRVSSAATTSGRASDGVSRITPCSCAATGAGRRRVGEARCPRREGRRGAATSSGYRRCETATAVAYRSAPATRSMRDRAPAGWWIRLSDASTGSDAGVGGAARARPGRTARGEPAQEHREHDEGVPGAAHRPSAGHGRQGGGPARLAQPTGWGHALRPDWASGAAARSRGSQTPGRRPGV